MQLHVILYTFNITLILVIFLNTEIFFFKNSYKNYTMESSIIDMKRNI